MFRTSSFLPLEVRVKRHAATKTVRSATSRECRSCRTTRVQSESMTHFLTLFFLPTRKTSRTCMLTINKTRDKLSANNAHLLYTCTSYTHSKSVQCAYTYTVYLYSAVVVVPVVVMVVVSQVTAQSSRKQRELERTARLAKRRRAAGKPSVCSHITPLHAAVSSRQDGRLRHVFAENPARRRMTAERSHFLLYIVEEILPRRPAGSSTAVRHLSAADAE